MDAAKQTAPFQHLLIAVSQRGLINTVTLLVVSRKQIAQKRGQRWVLIRQCHKYRIVHAVGHVACSLSRCDFQVQAMAKVHFAIYSGQLSGEVGACFRPAEQWLITAPVEHSSQ